MHSYSINGQSLAAEWIENFRPCPKCGQIASANVVLGLPVMWSCGSCSVFYDQEAIDQLDQETRG